MCADCHNTHSIKNFDIKTNSYSTTWAEMTVGCEACHGPGKQHVVAAKSGFEGRESSLLDMTGDNTAQVLVEKCGRCHSRRRPLTTRFKHDSNTLLDYYMPQLLEEGLYHGDGQIDDEVFVYGSFVQSKMYHNNVSCINCHDPHSARLLREGNQVCTACHTPEKYDTQSHHHHKRVHGNSRESNESQLGTGDRCVDCHMPGKVYMGNDFRRDHSFRIPRPDLTSQFDTPNACNNCHQDKSSEWAAEAVVSWFGEQRPPHFSESLVRVADNPKVDANKLLALLSDQGQPAIARATAGKRLLPMIQQPDVFASLSLALRDSSPLVRAAVAQNLYGLSQSLRISLLAELLNDPVRAVRIEAARSLIDVAPHQLSQEQRVAFEKAKIEYQVSLDVISDSAYGNHQRGLDSEKQGQLDKASDAYEQALKVDGAFPPSLLNLAYVRYRQQRLPEAEKLYRTVLEQQPDAAQVLYSLGLLLAEMGRQEEAETLLRKAATHSGSSRIWYNLAVLLHQQKKVDKAVTAYEQAIALEAENVDYIYGLASLYAQQKDWDNAFLVVEGALEKRPGHSRLTQLLQSLKQMHIR